MLHTKSSRWQRPNREYFFSDEKVANISLEVAKMLAAG